MTQTTDDMLRLARNGLVEDRIHERMWAISDLVPPIVPPAQHWLNSDSCHSYCRPCAIKARANEFGYGPPLRTDWWDRKTDLEHAFWEGIDGGFDTESDSTEACETCGRTLSYILTDYGVAEELGYYLEDPLTCVRDEDSYALDRLTLNIWQGTPRKKLLQAAIVVNHAYRLARRGDHLKQQEAGHGE